MDSITASKYKRLSVSSETERWEEEENVPSLRNRSYKTMRVTDYILIFFLFVSLSANSLFLARSFGAGSEERTCKSTYANVDINTYPREIYAHQEYVDDGNLTATALAWEALSGDPGVVALSDEFVATKKLPVAMRYPWDSSKGVYLVQGFHNLHCIRTVFRSIMDYHHGRPQRIALVHILHCLDELRQDVICHADDTPRYAGLQSPPGTGKGQVKMCGDWAGLQRWALANTACFRHEDEVPDRMVNRFKFCPDGSKPWLGKNLEEEDVD